MTNPQEHAGLNRQIHPPSSWLFLVLFLSFGFYISFNLQFILIIDFTLFLPLLVGWLANRYGLSLAPLVLVIGFVCTLNVGIHFMVYETIETIDMIGTATGWIYVLSLGCAIAFSREPVPESTHCIMNRRWVWLKWLIIPAIWLSAFERPDVSQEFNEYDLVLLDLGAMALLVIVALSVDRRKFLDWFSSLFLANSRKSSRMLLIGCVFVLCIASVLYISFDISRLLDLLNQEANIEFGFGASWALALVLAFFLTAFGVMNWKLVVPLVLVFYASDFMTYWFSDMLSPGPDMPLFPDDSAHDAEPDAYQATFKDAFLVRNGPGMVLGTCAALLGHALRPFWLYRESSSLRTARTTLTLLWVLIIYFVGFRFFEMNVSAPDLMVLGGLGYAMGLIWRIRGIVAAPAIMQLCLLLALTVIPSSDYHTSAVAFEAINVGLVVFPFAFVGFLSNRLESLPERPGALTPRAQGIK